jgi:catechol 2,3-dioxygenase-like lactoylglutathione lyase family enzyme
MLFSGLYGNIGKFTEISYTENTYSPIIMFAHISIAVSDIKMSINFYDQLMEALGYKQLFGDEKEGFMAYGHQESFFIINSAPSQKLGVSESYEPIHICLKAKTKEQVDLFHSTALSLCGTSDGQPGIRKEYAEDYYAAYILDPDGNKIEALTRI